MTNTSSTDMEQLRRLMPHLGSKIVCVVAQLPFRVNQSTFCSLEPLVFSDGSFPTANDFPKNGRIWWMIDGDKADIARPGQLVRATLEQSNKAGQQGSDTEWYQADRETITSNNIGFFEVLLIPDDTISHPYELIEQSIQFERPPHRSVLVEWRGDFYGLWRAESTATENAYEVRLTPEQKHHGRYIAHCIAGNDQELQKELRELRFAPAVSTSDRPNVKSGEDMIDLEISLAPKHSIVRRLPTAEKVLLTNDFELISDLLARESLLGEDNEGVRESLSKALSSLSTTGSWRRQDVQLAVKRIQQGVDVDEELRRRLAEALLRQGFLEEEVAIAVKDAAAKHTADIEQEAIEMKEKLESELDQLSERRDRIQNEVETILKQADEDAKDRVAQATEQTAGQLAELNAEIARLTTERDQLDSVVEPALERLQNARETILQDYILLRPLLEKANVSISDTADHHTDDTGALLFKQESHHRSGPSLNDQLQFVKDRFLPLLNRYRQHSNLDLAKYFHASVLACRAVLCHDLAWALAFAEATGGDAVIRCVEPDWLRFEQLWCGEFSAAWSAAVRDPDRLVFIVLDGVDRSPTAAWLLPVLNCAAGLVGQLPNPSGDPWPANLRLFMTLDANESSFKIDARLLRAVAAVPNKRLEIEKNIQLPAQGYIEPASWLEWTQPDKQEGLELATALDEHQVEGVYRPMALADCERLVATLIRFGIDKDKATSLAIRFRIQEPLDRLMSACDE